MLFLGFLAFSLSLTHSLALFSNNAYICNNAHSVCINLVQLLNTCIYRDEKTNKNLIKAVLTFEITLTEYGERKTTTTTTTTKPT
jgi:hypothetical protein